MNGWLEDFDITARARQRVAALKPINLRRGSMFFRRGDQPKGFVIVLSGRIEVFLTGPSGREIMLYAVENGQSCAQTTLGLMAAEAYSAEAIVATDTVIALIPRPLFTVLISEESEFRRYVLRNFAQRMSDLTRLLQQVAFGRIEARLAATLIDLAVGGVVQATQEELATRIGSAREVVSRRLDAFQRQGWIETYRGQIHLVDIPALMALRGAPI